MTECVRCQHPRAAHGGKGTACRFSRCGCESFDDGRPRPARPGARRVAIDVPDGYTLSVTLIPFDGEASAAQIPEPE